jgi:hypothetical protein
VYTDDPQKKVSKLAISGKVNRFVNINPRYARLFGAPDKEIAVDITITPESGYPFKITEVKARNGQNIAFELKPNSDPAKTGYVLSVKNLKKEKGRYSDVIYLKTDSAIKPRLQISVYGQIRDRRPKG